jgi:hypothetical protein
MRKIKILKKYKYIRLKNVLDIISFLIVLKIIRDGQIEFLIYNGNKYC